MIFLSEISRKMGSYHQLSNSQQQLSNSSATAQQQLSNSSVTAQQQLSNRSATAQQQLRNRSATDQQEHRNRLVANIMLYDMTRQNMKNFLFDKMTIIGNR